MNILLISAHAGGGVGSVLMDWVDRDINNHYTIALLDYANDKIERWGFSHPMIVYAKMTDYSDILNDLISSSDIVVLNYWNHHLLSQLLSRPLPKCRLVLWLHKNYIVSRREIEFPDIFLDTSPIQNHGRYIWSTINIFRYLNTVPKKHDRFTVGFVGAMANKKLHPSWSYMCQEIIKKIPDVLFTVVGANENSENNHFRFIRQVDDIGPYLSEFDILGYPLHPNHTGTCEQVLGEAMAAGVVPVVMDNSAEKIIWDGTVKTETDYINEIILLAQNPAEKYLLSVVARARAKKLYSIDTMIQRWNEVFEEMMEKPKVNRKPL